MRCVIAFLFGTALLAAAGPQFPAAAFYWDTTHVAVVIGQGADELPPEARKLPEPKVRPPYGDLFAAHGLDSGDGIKTGDKFDVNLTGKFWVRSTVDSFVYNKSEYSDWMLALATIDAADQDHYAAAIAAKLSVFLAEPAKPNRVSDTGPIRNPVIRMEPSASERATLEANLNRLMITKVAQAIAKQQSAAPDNLLSPLLAGKAKLSLEIDEVDLGEPTGLRQHVLATWTVGETIVFSVQGWKPPDTGHIESVEAIDGLPENKAEIIGAIGDWGEESLDDFDIANVFIGGQLIRYLRGYENSTIYLERMTAKGRELERTLYGI